MEWNLVLCDNYPKLKPINPTALKASGDGQIHSIKGTLKRVVDYLSGAIKAYREWRN